MATAENKPWPGCIYTLKPDQKLHFLSQMLFDKDCMIKRHMDTYADMNVSPLFAHQGRTHKQWRMMSLYICNVWSLKCFLGPIHMHNIYTCKYFASWSKHTHVSKRVFNLRSHAYSVHISILKGTYTCCTAGMYRLLMTTAMLFVHWSCT